MRSLDSREQMLVGGGASDEESAKDRALKICDQNNFSDDTKVTITVSETGGLGVSSTSWTNTSGTSIETTCGELRDAAEAETKTETKTASSTNR